MWSPIFSFNDEREGFPDRGVFLSDIPFVSIIIPIYNGEETIRACLDALGAQDYKNFEIIVVDSSSDCTPRIVGDAYPFVRLFHFEGRLSCGEARNIGIQESRGEFLLFVDVSIILDREYVSHALDFFANHAEVMGICGSIACSPEAGVIRTVDCLLEFYRWLDYQKELADTECLLGGCMMARKEIFVMDRFLDTHRHGEDVLFSLQAAKKGYRLVFLPSLRSLFLNKRKTFLAFLIHQFEVGRGSAAVRRIRFRRSFFTIFPVFIVSVPFYIVPEMGLSYLLGGRFHYFGFFLLYFPLFFLGNFFWSAGYLKEMSSLSCNYVNPYHPS